MKSRRRAREAALQAIYGCDTRADWSAAGVNLFFASFMGEATDDQEMIDGECLEFSRTLVDGVAGQLADIDSRIQQASVNWTLARMARVDRNILRLAVFEMFYLTDIPVKVSINEAIEIAKRFGTPESPVFVNGVLDKIASAVLTGPDSEQAA